ncbi:MASE1 domain-containing protein [Thalassotalea crassostreae]|uniref:MASE1 domain-containing protein n=1 Tax=Thalassotalea crassostreae TaxID=1763536 RepID=UPI000837FF79|nr:MASE1 domain-containing protein [Thalassotalea crassostreae]
MTQDFYNNKKSSKSILSIIVLSILYIIIAKVGMTLFSLKPTNITLFWLPAGLALIMYIKYKQVALPFIIVASFVANYSGMQLDNTASSIIHTTVASIIDGFAPYLGYVFMRFFKIDELDDYKSLSLFLCFVCILPSLVAGLLLTQNMVWGGYITSGEMFNMMINISFSDTVGMLLVYGIYSEMLSADQATNRSISENFNALIATSLLSLLLVWVAYEIFSLAILLIPVLLSVLAFKRLYVDLPLAQLAVICFILIMSILHMGPFESDNYYDSILLMMLFIFACNVCTNYMVIYCKVSDKKNNDKGNSIDIP